MSHPVHQRAPWSGHEPDRVSVRAVLKFVMFVFILIGVAAAITGAELHWFKVRQPDREAPNTADVSALPDRVKEWAQPGSDLVRLREQQQNNINSYGWVDESHKVARIPVSRAMELIAGEQRQPTTEKRP